ncbi:MAG TPA: substrate-binding domain-containing protein [Bryobacteraceae bacterium]|jgi:hypothetical protein
MKELLKLTRPPDGVFCYNDPVAAGAIKAVLESGAKIPEDVAIIGAGNVHYSDLLRVPLSTIDQGGEHRRNCGADFSGLHERQNSAGHTLCFNSASPGHTGLKPQKA